uniref:Protein kinase domain-containing protein n=1 Tax=Leptobrachium leishanense TaxID=445787 RepID=A0A8C5MRE3_9ANUR
AITFFHNTDYKHSAHKRGQGICDGLTLSFLYLFLSTGSTVALKLIRKDRTRLESFLQELHVSVLVGRHDSIIYTYPIHVLALDHFLIVQDFAPCGTLHSIIEPRNGVPEEKMKRCAEQLASALWYMHSKHQLIHGDLKPDNVLLMDKDCHQIKLADFGHARSIGQLVGRMSHIIPHMCPEICCLQENEYLYLTQSVDVWAFGILLYVALTGYFPWEKALELDHCFNVFAEWQNGGDYAAPPNGWETFTGEAMGMFSSLLTLDPVTRSTFEHFSGFLQSPWRTDGLIDHVVVEGEAFLVTTEEGLDQILIIPGDNEMILIETEGNVEYVEIEETVEESEDILLPQSFLSLSKEAV